MAITFPVSMGVLSGGERIILCHWGVVHRRHRDVDGGGVGVQRPVVGLVGERVRPVVVGGRGVACSAVGIDVDGRRGPARYHHGRSDCWSRCRCRRPWPFGRYRRAFGKRVLGGGEAIVAATGASFTGHGDVDGGGVGVGGAVVGLVGERVRPVVVGGRGVGVAAAVEASKAVVRRAGTTTAVRLLVAVSLSESARWTVLAIRSRTSRCPQRRHGVVGGDRGVVLRRDRDVDGGGVGVQPSRHWPGR